VFLACLLVGLAIDVAAQSLNPGPPGPFVVDVRGVTQGLPADAGLYPGAPAGSTIPGRALGVGLGGHVYLPAGIGLGAEATVTRGTATGARLSLETVSPFLSINFGTGAGWSYLGAGLGVARVQPSPGESLRVRSVVVGAGARWFPWRHLGVGFDLRVHRLSHGSSGSTALPRSTLMSAGVGVSVK